MISYMLEDCRILGVEYNLTGEPCAVNAACPVRRGGNGTPFCMGSRVLPYFPWLTVAQFKDEEVWTKEYIDFQDALSNPGHFLDVEYNHHRIHSALDYLTPAEFEARPALA